LAIIVVSFGVELLLGNLVGDGVTLPWLKSLGLILITLWRALPLVFEVGDASISLFFVVRSLTMAWIFFPLGNVIRDVSAQSTLEKNLWAF
jgi:hypothetical protein